MKKLFLMLLVMLSTFCFISMANVSAAEATYNASSGTELTYPSEGVVSVSSVAHGDILEVKYADGLAITEANSVLNIKGHVENMYRIQMTFKEGDGTKHVLKCIFETNGDERAVTTLDSNGYFEYHGDMSERSLSLVGKTIVQIDLQCYVASGEGTLQLLGLEFDADGSYDGFASLGDNNGNSGENDEPETPDTPNAGLSVGAFSSTDVTIEANADGEQVVTSVAKATDTWPVMTAEVSNYDSALSLFNFTFTASETLTLCFEINGAIDWSLAHATYVAGKQTISLPVENYVAEGETSLPASFTITVYIDGGAETAADKQIVIHSATFATEVVEEDPEQGEPDDGTLKISDFVSTDFTITDNADGEQVITYGAREASYPSMTAEVKNYDPNFTVLKMEYTASDVVKFGFNINGVIDWSLGHASYAAGTHTVTLLTANYVAEGEVALPSTFSIQVYVDAETAVTADKEITIHSVTFTTPDPEPEGMWFGTPKGTGLNCFEGENGYDISYNNDTASWRNVEIPVNNHEVEYDVIRIKLNVTEKTNVGVYVTYLDELGAATDTHIRNHWTAEGVVASTGYLDLVFLLGAHIGTGKTITAIKVYFDNPTDFTTNTGDCTAKLLSYELLKSSDLDLTDLEFSLEDATFDYTGEAVELDVECAQDVNFRFEYSNANTPEGEEVVWNVGTPKNAGEYNIRVSFLGSLEYNYATITAKVTINKVKATVNADDVTVDAQTRIVTVKDGIEASTDAEFAEGSEVLDGDEVPYGTVIYYRNAGDKNHTASDVLELKVERPVDDNPGEDNSGEDTPTEPGDDQPTEPGTGENPTPTPTPEKGCLGSVGASIIGVFALLGACLVAKRRKED